MWNKYGNHWIYYIVYSKCFTKANFIIIIFIIFYSNGEKKIIKDFSKVYNSINYEEQNIK